MQAVACAGALGDLVAAGEQDDVRGAGVAPGAHLPAELRTAAPGQVPVDDGEAGRVAAGAVRRRLPLPESPARDRARLRPRHLAEGEPRRSVTVCDEQFTRSPLAGSAARRRGDLSRGQFSARRAPRG